MFRRQFSLFHFGTLHKTCRKKLSNIAQLDKSIQMTNIVRQLVVTNVHQRTAGSVWYPHGGTDGGRGKPLENTLRALRVLRWYNNSTSKRGNRWSAFQVSSKAFTRS